MSNKLKKFSEGYKETKNEIRELIEKEGGLNVTPALMRKFTEVEDESKKITDDEFYTALSELTEEGYRLYKIVQVCKGREERGMMICSKDTTVAFARDPKNDEEPAEAEVKEEVSGGEGDEEPAKEN